MKKSQIKKEYQQNRLLVFGAVGCVGLMIFSSTLAIVCFRRLEQRTSELTAYKNGFSLKPYAVGETAEDVNLSIKVIAAKNDAVSSPMLPPPPGQRFVVVTIAIKNKTNSEKSFIPTLQTYLRDAVGNKYELTAAPGITEPSAAGKLAPGEEAKGSLAFAVPSKTTKLTFYYVPDSFVASKTVAFAIDINDNSK